MYWIVQAHVCPDDAVELSSLADRQMLATNGIMRQTLDAVALYRMLSARRPYIETNAPSTSFVTTSRYCLALGLLEFSTYAQISPCHSIA